MDAVQKIKLVLLVIMGGVILALTSSVKSLVIWIALATETELHKTFLIGQFTVPLIIVTTALCAAFWGLFGISHMRNGISDQSDGIFRTWEHDDTMGSGTFWTGWRDRMSTLIKKELWRANIVILVILSASAPSSEHSAIIYTLWIVSGWLLCNAIMFILVLIGSAIDYALHRAAYR